MTSNFFGASKHHKSNFIINKVCISYRLSAARMPLNCEVIPPTPVYIGICLAIDTNYWFSQLETAVIRVLKSWNTGKGEVRIAKDVYIHTAKQGARAAKISSSLLECIFLWFILVWLWTPGALDIPTRERDRATEYYSIFFFLLDYSIVALQRDYNVLFYQYCHFYHNRLIHASLSLKI